jgi:epoxyqueuosine reductase QueG
MNVESCEEYRRLRLEHIESLTHLWRCTHPSKNPVLKTTGVRASQWLIERAKAAESELRKQIKAHSYSCSICMTRPVGKGSTDTTEDAFQVSEGSSMERPILVRTLHLIRSYALSSPPRFLERWLG